MVIHWHTSSCLGKTEHEESNVKFLVIFQLKVPEVTSGIFFFFFFRAPGLGCYAGIILDLCWQKTGRALCRYRWVESWQETLCTLGVMVFRRVLMAVGSNLIKTTCLCYRFPEFPVPAAGDAGLSHQHRCPLCLPSASKYADLMWKAQKQLDRRMRQADRLYNFIFLKETMGKSH